MPALTEITRSAVAAAAATALAYAARDAGASGYNESQYGSGSDDVHARQLHRRGAKEDLTPSETQKYVHLVLLGFGEVSETIQKLRATAAGAMRSSLNLVMRADRMIRVTLIVAASYVVAIGIREWRSITSLSRVVLACKVHS